MICQVFFVCFVVVLVVVFCLCSKKQGYDHLLFLMSFREKKFQMKTFGVHWLIIWYPEETCFHVHGSYGTVFFINRYMYFCVVAFINDTITLSFSCLPLNFSFLQIYIKTCVTFCGFWVRFWSSFTGKCEILFLTQIGVKLYLMLKDIIRNVQCVLCSHWITHFVHSLNHSHRRQVGGRIGKASTKPSSQTIFIYIY